MARHITVCSQIYFSKMYDINNEGLAIFSLDIVENSSGYFLGFISQSTSSSNKRIGFLLLDFNGDILSPVKIYEDLVIVLKRVFQGAL